MPQCQAPISSRPRAHTEEAREGVPSGTQLASTRRQEQMAQYEAAATPAHGNVNGRGLQNRWIQLAIGVVCMGLVANLQYGWTLFVSPMDARHHWGALGPIAKDYGFASMPVTLLGLTLPLLTMTLSIDNLCNGFTRPLCGFLSDKFGRESGNLGQGIAGANAQAIHHRAGRRPAGRGCRLSATNPERRRLSSPEERPACVRAVAMTSGQRPRDTSKSIPTATMAAHSHAPSKETAMTGPHASVPAPRHPAAPDLGLRPSRAVACQGGRP